LTATARSGHPIEQRPGFAAMLEKIESNGIRTIIVDWEAVQIGKSIFLHKDVPKGWWEEYCALVRDKFRPLAFVARTSMTSYTWTEVRRMVEPIGDEWLKYDLELKYGMRDGLSCPVGGRWIVVFWSRKVLSNILTQRLRVVIVAAASFAALRLEKLAGPDPKRIGSRGSLTPREMSALRLASTGAQTHAIAQALGLGEETVRSHLKKAQTKLSARSRAHAVAEALRQRLIP
jgi:DNA-binding CsgD family transcriptional regulator